MNITEFDALLHTNDLSVLSDEQMHDVDGGILFLLAIPLAQAFCGGFLAGCAIFGAAGLAYQIANPK